MSTKGDKLKEIRQDAIESGALVPDDGTIFSPWNACCFRDRCRAATSDRDALLSENVALRERLAEARRIVEQEIADTDMNEPNDYRDAVVNICAPLLKPLGIATPSEPEHGKGAL